MNELMFLLRCPNCKNLMKYHTKDKFLTGKRKRCVYCGKSFDCHKNYIKEIDR